MVLYAYEHSAYYRRLYQGIDIGSVELEQLPVINKSALVEHLNEFVTVSDIKMEKLEKYFMEPFTFEKRFLNKYLAFHTSGSTGNPTYVVWGPKEFAVATFLLLHRNIGLIKADKRSDLINKEKKYLYFGILDDYVGGNSWVYQMKKNVNVKIISIFSSPDKWKETINSFQPDIIMAKPHVLSKLAQLIERGELFINPEKLIFVGEMLRPRDKELIQKNFKCPVKNSYSTCETGPVAWQAGMEEKLVGLHEEVIIELLDENNQKITEYYKEGRLVITNLYNHVMPIIRYDIGDRACFVPNEKAGEFSTISYIKGRDTGSFSFINKLGQPEMVSEYPFWSLDIPGVARYQVIQMSREELQIRLELDGKEINKDEVLEKFQKKVNRIFLERDNMDNLKIYYEIVDRIMPNKAGKIKVTIPLK